LKCSLTKTKQTNETHNADSKEGGVKIKGKAKIRCLRWGALRDIGGGCNMTSDHQTKVGWLQKGETDVKESRPYKCKCNARKAKDTPKGGGKKKCVTGVWRRAKKV